MNTLAERLSLALSELNASQAELARACGIAPASVHGWMTGKTKTLKGASLLKAAAFLHVRDMWLAEGKGPMRREHIPHAEYQPAAPSQSSWPFWAITPERYDALPPYLKGMIEGRVQSMIEEWEEAERGNGQR
jgi:transcriptional regulator with XRE-family HTH domain